MDYIAEPDICHGETVTSGTTTTIYSGRTEVTVLVPTNHYSIVYIAGVRVWYCDGCNNGPTKPFLDL